MLEKKATLYERDEKGKLLPQIVELEVDERDLELAPELKGQTLAVVPMTRGEIKRLFGDVAALGAKDEVTDVDIEVVEKFCSEPKYTKEELPFVKPVYVRCIVNTVMRESGLILPKNRKKGAKLEADDDFAKN